MYHITLVAEKKIVATNLLAPYEIISKNTTAQSPFPYKMHLPHIHEQRMLYSAIMPPMIQLETIRKAVQLSKNLCQ